MQWTLAYDTNPIGLKQKTRRFPAVAFFVVHAYDAAVSGGLPKRHDDLRQCGAYDELCEVAEEMIAISDAVDTTSEPQSA